MGLATFPSDGFPWEIDFPVRFLLLFPCSAPGAKVPRHPPREEAAPKEGGPAAHRGWRHKGKASPKASLRLCAAEGDSEGNPKQTVCARCERTSQVLQVFPSSSCGPLLASRSLLRLPLPGCLGAQQHLG